MLSVSNITFKGNTFEQLWDMLADIPIDDDAQYIEQDFLHFDEGTELVEVWHWFEHYFCVSLGEYMYGKLEASFEIE